MQQAGGRYADGYPDGDAALAAAVDRAQQAHADGRARNDARIAERVAELRVVKQRAVDAAAASRGASAAAAPQRKRARHSSR
jgi:hypothetical protein